MEQVIEFSTNHWPLVASFLILLILAVNLEIKKSGSAISVHELTARVNQEDACVLDVREKKDFQEGHIVDAINVPLIKLDGEIKNLEKYKSKPIIVVCNLGQHAGQAVRKLEAAGFENVSRLSGGISGWRSEKLPVVKS
jgi:rhodanese-related sulfurtransferase